MRRLYCSECDTEPRVVEHDGEVVAACECMKGIPIASTEDPQPIVQRWLDGEWIESPDDS